MIDPVQFLNKLKECDVDYFCGVPDSLLKEFLTILKGEAGHHVAANEGAAVAMACGYQMACGRLPLVYMQNSGLGNAVNPLMSLVHQKVYAVPMLLLIGHRGAVGKHDEPQHLPMGSITEALLELMSVPVYKLNADSELSVLGEAVQRARQSSAPVAVLVSAGTFAAATSHDAAPVAVLKRAQVIRLLIEAFPHAAFMATTGYTGRELMEERRALQSTGADFLNAGAMGHVSQIALGLTQGNNRPVVVLDGDGAALMHLGGFATIGSAAPRGFLHVVLNNGMHESVGGQALCGSVDFAAVARACGYSRVVRIDSLDGLKEFLAAIDIEACELCLLEIIVSAGVRDKLGRPSDDFIALKEEFRKHLG